MIVSFLSLLFLAGITVAVLQDLKRREVDDWLNLFLIVASFSFILMTAFFEKNPLLVFQLGFTVVLMFILMNAFYYGHVFAGGDAKLLFAMTALFIGVNFVETLTNIGLFILFLMLSGAVYGLLYSLVLYFMNFKEVNSRIKKEFGGRWVLVFVLAGVFLTVISFIDSTFFLLTLFIFFFPVLYLFAKGLENVSMIRTIKGRELREGDWLAEDISLGDRVIKASWDGVSKEEMEYMKNLRRVKIKEGLPFVPAFLIAFLVYIFWRDFVLELIFKLIV